MKTGNTLRTAKNYLLCFFMALAGGFLVACGGDGVRFTGGDGVGVPASPGGLTISSSPLVTDTNAFPAYLVDTAVQGVSVSGPTGDSMTGESGVFLASEGVFEFSIGGTDLGSVQLDSDWANNEVTPSDFIGVASEQVITIARIMQALDEDSMLTNGISISQNTRDNAPDLFTIINDSGEIATGPIGGKNFTIPSAADAEGHLVATRQCLFSGGYVGAYRANGDLDDASIERGTIYYAVEPFADRARRFGFTADVGALQSFDNNDVGGGPDVFDGVGVARSVLGENSIGLSQGAAGGEVDFLNFITPRSVDGTWNRVMNGTVAFSGTHDLAAVAGNPGATRRIVGVETTDDTGATVVGMYVLDHFAKDNEDNGGVFSGQYYSVNDEGIVSMSPLTLTIAAGAWFDSTAAAAAETTLTLMGTRGEEDTTIIMGIVHSSAADADEDYGTFFDGSGTSADSLLSGTWCDIGGAVGSSTVAPIPPARSNIPQIYVINWDAVPGATSYKLYRATVSVGISDQVGDDIPSTVTLHVDTPPAGPAYFYRVEACNSAGCSGNDPDPAAGGGDGNGGDGNGGDGNGDGNGGDGNGGDGNGGGGGAPAVAVCMEQTYTAGQSCEWKGETFVVGADGSGRYAGTGSTNSQTITLRGLRRSADGPLITFVATRSGTTWTITELG